VKTDDMIVAPRIFDRAKKVAMTKSLPANAKAEEVIGLPEGSPGLPGPPSTSEGQAARGMLPEEFMQSAPQLP